jgi:hypothetical protein
MALVDTILPRTPSLAYLYGEVMYYGALDFYTDEYLVMMLQFNNIPTDKITADFINFVATQYMFMKEGYHWRIPQRVTFASLSLEDRFGVLNQLDKYETYFFEAFIPLQNYSGSLSITSTLDRYTMLGYYSEWFGYGSTRLLEPSQRTLEFNPQSWQQVNYPGPSFSYLSSVKEYYAIRKQTIIP